jgi:hypothetical protein
MRSQHNSFPRKNMKQRILSLPQEAKKKNYSQITYGYNGETTFLKRMKSKPISKASALTSP